MAIIPFNPIVVIWLFSHHLQIHENNFNFVYFGCYAPPPPDVALLVVRRKRACLIMYIALISKFADTFTINFIGEEVPNLASPEYIADNKGCFALHKVLDQMI